MEAHAASLRSAAPERAEWVEAVRRDWRRAELTSRERALLEYAVKLTHEPWTARKEDLDPLRREGLDDRAILDLVHVTGFFAHANRLADGLGCDLEVWMRAADNAEGG